MTLKVLQKFSMNDALTSIHLFQKMKATCSLVQAKGT